MATMATLRIPPISDPAFLEPRPLMFMMRPQPRSFMCGNASRAHLT